MARAATQDDLPPVAAPPAKKPGNGLLAVFAAAILAAAGSAGGVYFMVGKSAHAPAAAHGDAHGDEAAAADAQAGAAAKSPAQYLPLTPSIVVNLEDDLEMRYLQVDVEVMTRDAAALDAVKLHMPRIRNTLMLLFTQQKYEAIVSREGKQALQAKALEEVQNVLKEETGKTAIDALYFTNFVMQ